MSNLSNRSHTGCSETRRYSLSGSLTRERADISTLAHRRAVINPGNSSRSAADSERTAW